MLQLTKRRTLELHAAEPRPFLSAASGLVRVGRRFYVVADDELHLGVFSTTGAAPGRLVRLFPGELPLKNKKRKKKKPDLEALIVLPQFKGYPFGALLALGSGSGPLRYRASLLSLDERKGIDAAPREIDATPLYAKLASSFDDLNIEGGWVAGDSLHLLQRGNKGATPNAVIQIALRPFLSALTHQDKLPAKAPEAIHTIALGDVKGVPLCFSDASPLPDGRWLFTAIAEDTDNSYADGACLGAAIGMADGRHQVSWIKRIKPIYKIEGIDVRLRQGALEAFLVSDADDPAIPASLLSVVL